MNGYFEAVSNGNCFVTNHSSAQKPAHPTHRAQLILWIQLCNGVDYYSKFPWLTFLMLRERSWKISEIEERGKCWKWKKNQKRLVKIQAVNTSYYVLSERSLKQAVHRFECENFKSIFTMLRSTPTWDMRVEFLIEMCAWCKWIITITNLSNVN